MDTEGGTFGFNGEQNRGFDLPAGVLSDFTVSPSKPGRARFRYNDVTKQMELSVDAGGYVPISTGTGTSPWVEMGGVIRPQNVTDDVVIGTAVLVGSETLRVVGDVRFEPDDSSGGFNVVDGGGNTVLSATQAGDVTVGNQLVITERVGDPGATANAGKLYTKDNGGTTDLFYQASDGTVTQITPGGGGSPGGVNTNVQFNDSGSFGGNADFVYDGTNVTTANALFADGGIDRSAAAGLSIGATNATSVVITPDTTISGATFADGGLDRSGAAVLTIGATNATGVTITPDTTIAGATFANGGLDRSSAAALAIGATNATSVDVTPPLALIESAGDPGATANQGKLYTKDDGGTTELFFQASDGTVSQLTPLASGGAAIAPIVAGENLAAGAPVAVDDNGGSPGGFLADADGTDVRANCVGLAQAAIASAASGNIVTSGQVDVPDAQWAAVPGTGDVGLPVYISTTPGILTLTAPGSGAYVSRVGTVYRGGAGQVRVLVNVVDPILTEP